MTIPIAVIAVAILVLLLAVWIGPRLVRHAWIAEAVHHAVVERLDHEKERPQRYPPHHRELSTYQRVQRQLHADGIRAPTDLRDRVRAALKRHTK